MNRFDETVGTTPRHITGWFLIVLGICLLWLWQNFRETFGGHMNLPFISVESGVVAFVLGVVSLVGGALLARGGWEASIYYIPLRYVVGFGLVGAAASTYHPIDMMRRWDTWVAFHTLKPSLNAISREVPRGLTSMECDLQLGSQQAGGPDPGCKQIFATRTTRRSPTEDSLYSAMVDAQVRGFFDIEMRPTHFAVVRILPSPGIRKGFLKLHEADNMSTLPQQLFLHQIADVYPLGDGWFHFVTR